jgi:hypothetical protein
MLSHHHTYYVTSSCILCHITIPATGHRHSRTVPQLLRYGPVFLVQHFRLYDDVTYVYDDVTYVHDDVTYVYDDETYVYDDVTYVYDDVT